MNERVTPPQKKPLVMILGGVLVAVVAVAVSVMLKRVPEDGPLPQPAPEPPAAMTVEQAHELMRMAQLANGHLENIELAAADALYAEVLDRLPAEPLAARNQAICRYLLLEQQKIDTAAVESSLDRLQAVEPESSATYWLLGKATAKAGIAQAPVAVQHFQRAAELSPDEAVYWYEAYDTARVMPDGGDQAKQFLAEAYRLAPNNLFLLGDWLLAQATTEDPAIAKTLQAARTTFEPLRDTVLKRHRVDVFQLLDNASDALTSGNWSEVVRNARICLNVTRPNDFTQGDKRAIAPHALEFMLHAWSEEFLARFSELPTTEPLIDVRFTRMSPTEIRGDIRNALMVDFDLDQTLELLVLDANAVTVYEHLESGAWQQLASLVLAGSQRGLLAADLDRDRDHEVNPSAPGAEGASATSCFDADSDVVVYGESGLQMIRNVRSDDGTRTLEIVDQDESVNKIRDVVTAILVDFDHDSNLDIVASTRQGLVALLGQGDMLFSDVSRYSDFPKLDAATPISSLVAVDWDRDVDIDIVAVAAGQALGYLENLRHGNFRWQPFDETYAPARDARSLAVVESDGNVSWDLVAAGSSGTTLLKTRTPQPGKVLFQEAAAIATEAADGVVVAEMDNNGAQDAIVWTADVVSILRGHHDGRFTQPLMLGDLPPNVQACDYGDLDNDGDLDLCIVAASEVVLYENVGGNQNNWLSIRAMGQVDNAGKANHHGIGSLLEVKAGPRYEAQVVARPVTHFGLGGQPNAAIVRFLWTNGVPQDKLQPAANQVMCELMTLKGSCPYVYTWTGERFEFFTDCLWAAPIGLQLAEDVLAPSRSWEYLHIPGDRLRERDGCYALQVTEELWEAGYFDQVELMAVDHPADVEIFSNEKVGPAEISQFKLYPVRQRRYPVAARDQRGRDVLRLIDRQDGQFLRAFDKTIVPGLAEEHFLELDLGQLDSPEQITLFLTGWIYPTDTSLNVALSRHPRADGPRPPAVLVPDADGQWREAQAYMGFPGGKTKTISVDLSQAFLAADYRVRIVTTAEIYWDEVFFAVDEQPAELRLTPLVLESADLHYRGFSRANPQSPHAPETYDYANVQTAPKWPPMRGSFTRYGDVRELLTDADDRMAILASGDEMTLRFRASAVDLPAGWVRDFVMHNVGWDKDADLNTIYGQSVEPLPYRAMTSYPYGPEASFPSSAAHEDYLHRYQTRVQQSQGFWRRVKDYVPPN